MPKVLRTQAREMVFKVHTFMKKEAEEGLQYEIKAAQKRTAAATGVSIRTVRNITVQAKASSNVATAFQTPGRKRPRKKKVTGINGLELGRIKRCVHHFHITESKLPTTKTLLKKVQEEIEFKGCKTSFSSVLQNLGFKWKKTKNKHKILIEDPTIRLKRIQYLQNITKYRTEGRPVIYLEETFVDSNHTDTKGQRVIVVYAGSRAGSVPNALLMFKASTKSGDYHGSMNWDNYVNWIHNMLIPNLPENAVIVVDINASFHSQLEDAVPTPYSKKSEMESWLIERGIPYSSIMFKPELYQLINLNKDNFKKYSVDQFFKENNHVVLRLPPCHPDLNPMKTVSAAIKRYVSEKNVTWDIDEVMSLINEKLNGMSETEWSTMWPNTELIEEEYKKSDLVIDRLTDDMTFITGNDSDKDSSSDEFDSVVSEDSDSNEEQYHHDHNYIKEVQASPVFIEVENVL